MIREVKASDYPAIAKVMMRAFANPPWNEDWDYSRAYQRIEQLDDGKYTRCYVYEENEKIIGVLCGKLITYVNNLELMIEDCYIDPDYQRLGIGGKLMQGVVDRLKEVDAFTLLTGQGFYSVDFYLKNGFKINNNLVLMRKELK